MSYGAAPYGQGGYGVLTVTKTAETTVVLEEQGNLTVAVTDDGGDAISDASVSISGASSASAQTDESGTVVFDGLEVADYQLTVTADGYFDAETTVAASDFG